MATWAVSIEVQDRTEKRIRVTGVRTDGEDVRTYSAAGQVDVANLQASLRSVMDTLFASHTAAVAAEAADATLISGWEDTAATYLDGLEI